MKDIHFQKHADGRYYAEWHHNGPPIPKKVMVAYGSYRAINRSMKKIYYGIIKKYINGHFKIKYKSICYGYGEVSIKPKTVADEAFFLLLTSDDILVK